MLPRSWYRWSVPLTANLLRLALAAILLIFAAMPDARLASAGHAAPAAESSGEFLSGGGLLSTPVGEHSPPHAPPHPAADPMACVTVCAGASLRARPVPGLGEPGYSAASRAWPAASPVSQTEAEPAERPPRPGLPA